jgi:hypothetical protein
MSAQRNLFVKRLLSGIVVSSCIALPGTFWLFGFNDPLLTLTYAAVSALVMSLAYAWGEGSGKLDWLYRRLPWW